MDYQKNYIEVMKKFFPKKKIGMKEAKKALESVQKTRIGKSALFEWHFNPSHVIVTDLANDTVSVFAPRGRKAKNEELNLVSGVTSLGLFDTDNVYCGQLDPNQTGVGTPIVISDGEDSGSASAVGLSIPDGEIAVGVKYDTIFGEFEVVSVADGNVVVRDNNAVEMVVSEDDFSKLNPVQFEEATDVRTDEQDTDEQLKDKFRIVFKTMQNDGSVKEWCIVTDSEEEMSQKLDEIKERPDLIEITSILSPQEVGSEEEEEASSEEEDASEGGSYESPDFSGLDEAEETGGGFEDMESGIEEEPETPEE